MTQDETSYNFFFYGTLMHPSILTRVIGHAGDGLTFQDCILPGYVRHCVKNADYPAIIPVASSSRLLKRELTDEEACVRGTFVRGLRRNDVMALDAFEGDEYIRAQLSATSSTSPFFATPTSFLTLSPPSAYTIPSSSSTSSLIPSASSSSSSTPLPSASASKFDHPSITLKQVYEQLGDGVEGYGRTEGWVYVWARRDESGRDVVGLEEEIWDFESFLRDKSHRWTGHPPDKFPSAAAAASGSNGMPSATQIMSAIRASTPGGSGGGVGGRDEEEFRAADEVRERLRKAEKSENGML